MAAQKAFEITDTATRGDHKAATTKANKSSKTKTFTTEKDHEASATATEAYPEATVAAIREGPEITVTPVKGFSKPRPGDRKKRQEYSQRGGNQFEYALSSHEKTILYIKLGVQCKKIWQCGQKSLGY